MRNLLLGACVLGYSGFLLAGQVYADSPTSNPCQTSPATAKKELTKLPGIFVKSAVESTPLWYQGREIMFYCQRPLIDDQAKAAPLMSLVLCDMDGKELAHFGHGYSLGCAFVEGDTVHVFAAKATTDDWFHDIFHFSSKDLKTWKQELAVARAGNEHLLNSSVCRDPQGYLMVYETDLPVRCCFKFARSKDLHEWKKIDGLAFAGIDGKELSGCPVIRYCAPYYYAIYMHQIMPGHNGYTSFLARSRDLVTWQLSPNNPILEASKDEGCNNSDVDLIEIGNKTYVYYCDGDQREWGDLKLAVYPGSMREFFESYFPPKLKPVEVSAKLP